MCVGETANDEVPKNDEEPKNDEVPKNDEAVALCLWVVLMFPLYS